MVRIQDKSEPAPAWGRIASVTMFSFRRTGAFAPYAHDPEKSASPARTANLRVLKQKTRRNLLA
jgi:hypothetical protein